MSPKLTGKMCSGIFSVSNIHPAARIIFQRCFYRCCTKFITNGFFENDGSYMFSDSRTQKKIINFVKMSTDKPKLVSLEESRRFMVDCFKAVKVPDDHACTMADLLIAADHRGHLSHGMNRLEMYLNDLQLNVIDGCAVPEVLKETPATAWVDGKNGLGAVVGNFCMDLAISKAQTVGVGWVCAKRCTHFGIAAYYPKRAMDQGLLGISMTNSSPLMAPTRSKVTALGTNPFSVGAPAKDDQFVLDMATTSVALGKIEIQKRKGEPIPNGWALDPEGKETHDAELAYKTLCLMPLGGSEKSSGYKGYGLGAVVDILSGVMAGAKYSKKIRPWNVPGCKDLFELGQLFVAVNPNCFAPGFEERMADMNSLLRGCTPADPSMPVLVAGDKEFASMEAIDKAGGVQYSESQLKNCEELSKRLNVKPLSFI